MMQSFSVFLFFATLLCAQSQVFAQSLWQTTKGQHQSATRSSGSHLEALRAKGSMVQINRLLLEQLTLNDSFQLPLSGVIYPASINRIQIHDNGSKTWFATIETVKASMPVIITADERNVFVRLTSPKGIYNLTALDGRGYLVNESTLAQVIDYDQTDVLLPEKPELTEPEPNTSKPKALKLDVFSRPENLWSNDSLTSKTEDLRSAAATSDEVVQVDVLVAYTPGAEQLYSGAIQTRVNHLFAITNQIYADSGVFIHINPVAFEPVAYSDSVSSSAALSDIRSERGGAFANIDVRRYEVGADMVVLMRPYARDGYCGMAYGNGSNGTVRYSSNRMYSHVSVDCSDYVLSHELGHNMGLAHSRLQDKRGYTFDFALGYGVSNKFGTVMTYEWLFRTQRKILKFSSPVLDCNGEPCGIARTDKVNGADAVFALNSVRHELAGFYSSDPDLTLISDVLKQIKDENLRTCIKDSIQYSIGLKAKYASFVGQLNCDSMAVQSLEGLSAFTELSQLLLRKNQISDISPISGLTNLRMLYLDDNIIEDISPLSTLSNVSYLGLSDNNISNIAPLGSMNLNWLSIEGNPISDIADLAKLTNLDSLYLGGKLIVDISPLYDLKHLSSLSLNNSPNIDLSLLHNITTLKGLAIRDVSIKDLTPISNLSNIISLSLSNAQLANIALLSNMKQLVGLQLTSNPIADISPLAGLSQLEFLTLSDNQITDITAIKYLTWLRYLDLSENQIADIDPIKDIVNLRQLNLSHNQISDISALASIREVEELKLASNRISDISALNLSRKIYQLDLANNRIADITTLADLPMLAIILLNNNQLSDLSPLFNLYYIYYINLFGNDNLICEDLDQLSTPSPYPITVVRPASCRQANDLDGDGVLNDRDNCPMVANPLQTNTDGAQDGGDACDDDDDNDGILDTADEFPLDANEFQDHDHDGIGDRADQDDDGDGVIDVEDAFPLDASESLDTDGDGVGDNRDNDDDNDGILDQDDAFSKDARESLDSDHDGIGNNADIDDDNDGINDSVDAFPLDSTESVDTDGDGIGNNADQDDDNDGLTDQQETTNTHTNPLLADSDSDGLDDGGEINQYLTDPLNADTDNDGMLDGFEVANQLDPLTAQNIDSDLDNDGLTDVEEMQYGTDPRLADTDGDALIDYDEVKIHHTNPLLTDSDGDTLSDHDEITRYGSDPLKIDSDDDQMPDRWEVQFTLNPVVDDSTRDEDGDGRDNLTEFQDDTNPNVPEIVDMENNATLETAQNIDLGFNLSFSANIGDHQINTSQTLPHASVLGKGLALDQTVEPADIDVYSVTVAVANARLIVDLDQGLIKGPSWDSYIEIYDANGAQVSNNDDANWYTDGQGGSVSELDSYIDVILPQAGIYYIKVMSYPDAAIPADTTYTLQLTLQGHSVGTVSQGK